MNIVEHTENGLYYRSWLSAKPRAAVLLVHGLGEHCQRYDHVAKALNDEGYAVFSMDLPGHGRSEGPRGHVDTFDVFQNAVQSLFDHAQTQLPTVPKSILGHSMGGLIVSRFLIDHQALFNGAMLSAPAIQSPQEPPAWQVGLIKMIAKLTPKAGMLALDASGVSRDPAEVKKYMADPLVSKDELSAKFLVEMTNTMDTVKLRADEITLPILMMHGTGDVMTAIEGTQQLHQRCASADKELKIYPDLYHELFNEPEKEQVLADLIQWINQRLC